MLMEENISPFLRWAGGKKWLIKHLDKLLPADGFNRYFEPFLGGGSIFLAINPQKKSFLSDLNEELIQTYSTLKESPESIIEVLEQFQNTKEFYYEIREEQFKNSIQKAARFIYLNQTSFNGIYRVNLKGKYNVPYGFRTKNFLEKDKLIAVSERLKNTALSHGDFFKIKSKVKEKDLIFLDPPYTVSHNDNGFIKYNQKLFSLKDQERLSKLIDHIKDQGAFYILTNAAHKKIDEIFNKGDYRFVKERASLVGGINAERGQIKEYVFTNINNS